MIPNAFGDIFDSRALLDDVLAERRATVPNDSTRNRSANRQKCAQVGHRYLVHGKVNPTKVACGRCEVSWAIGPRTEPTS